MTESQAGQTEVVIIARSYDAHGQRSIDRVAYMPNALSVVEDGGGYYLYSSDPLKKDRLSRLITEPSLESYLPSLSKDEIDQLVVRYLEEHITSNPNAKHA